MGTAQMMMCFRDFVENTAFEIGSLLKKVRVGSGFLPPVSRRAFSCFTCSKMSRGNALLTPNKNKTSREVHLDCLTKGVTEFLQRDVVDLLVVRKFGVKASYCLRLVVEIPLFTRVFIYTSQVVQDFFQKRFIEIFSGWEFGSSSRWPKSPFILSKSKLISDPFDGWLCIRSSIGTKTTNKKQHLSHWPKTSRHCTSRCVTCECVCVNTRFCFFREVKQQLKKKTWIKKTNTWWFKVTFWFSSWRSLNHT